MTSTGGELVELHPGAPGSPTESGSKSAPETVIAGKYRLVSEIGRGGMGSVWRAEHLSWRAPVAVKLMTIQESSRTEALARFQREVRLAAGLRSPHVVQVLDHGIDEASGLPFIAMELLEGVTLAQRLERDGRLQPAETYRIINQLARALTRAHDAGIVHRDLKPDNVFLVRNGDEYVVKVLDFGLAKLMESSLPEGNVSRPGTVLGTPFYMSPEQIRGAKLIDHRADLWSLSAIVVECLTGRRPFQAQDFAQLAALLLGGEGRRAPSELGPVPRGVDEWFARATARSVDDRFQSVSELVTSLAPLCGELGTHETHFESEAEGGAAFAATASVAAVSKSTRIPSRRARLRSTVLTVVGGLAIVGVALALVMNVDALWATDAPVAPAANVVPESETPPPPALVKPRAEPTEATRAGLGIVRPLTGGEAEQSDPVEEPAPPPPPKKKKTRRRRSRPKARPRPTTSSTGNDTPRPAARSIGSTSAPASTPSPPSDSVKVHGRRIRSSLPASE